MIYKFKSKAAGDVIMLGPDGDEMLRVIGRAPAAQGIIETTAMAAALSALQQAADASETPVDDRADAQDGKPQPVGQRQRLWPMVELLRRAAAAGEPVVWGV